MIKYFCDRCGKMVCSSHHLISTTLQAVCPAEEVQVDFCPDCYDSYAKQHAEAKIAVDMKFLKEMKRS